jgi:hypothetical protein
MNKQSLKEVANKLYPINNTGSMFMANREEVNNSYRQEGFIECVNYAEKSLYSEEEVKLILDKVLIDHSDIVLADIPEWFENNKKK